MYMKVFLSVTHNPSHVPKTVHGLENFVLWSTLVLFSLRVENRFGILYVVYRF
jgi:hypothetical protein